MTTTPTIRYVPLAHDLRNLLVDMTTRYGTSCQNQAYAWSSAKGTFDGKTGDQWASAHARQFKAILRLTRSLRDLAEKGA